eukprot:sb/3467192/
MVVNGTGLGQKIPSDTHLTASWQCFSIDQQPSAGLTSVEDIVELSKETPLLLRKYLEWDKLSCLKEKDGELKWAKCATVQDKWEFEVVGPGAHFLQSSLSVKIKLRDSNKCMTSPIGRPPRWANETTVKIMTCENSASFQEFIMDMKSGTGCGSIMINGSDGSMFYALVPTPNTRPGVFFDVSELTLEFCPQPNHLTPCSISNIKQAYGVPQTNLTAIPRGIEVIMECPGGDRYTATCNNRALIPLVKCREIGDEMDQGLEEGRKEVSSKLLYTLYAVSGAFCVCFPFVMAAFVLRCMFYQAKQFE